MALATTLPLSRRGLTISLLVLVGVLVSSCVEPVFLPDCPTTVEKEPSGDLASDMLGAWYGSVSPVGSHHHPLTAFAADGVGVDQYWMFRDDGTGHVWWAYSGKGGADDDDFEFDWQVVDGRLVVEDLAPAEVTMSASSLVIHAIDTEVNPNAGWVWSRCDLDVPEGIRGF